MKLQFKLENTKVRTFRTYISYLDHGDTFLKAQSQANYKYKTFRRGKQDNIKKKTKHLGINQSKLAFFQNRNPRGRVILSSK